MDIQRIDPPPSYPTTPIHIAVVQPMGRDTAPVMAQICLHRAILRQIRHPITNQEVYVHPFPYNVIGDEYARARNALVDIVFQAEQDATAQAQEQENQNAAAEGRKPGIAQPFRYDYLLWVDDDTMIPETAVEQLLSAQSPIASGLYFMRKQPYLPVAYLKTSDPAFPERYWNLTSYPKNQTIEVDAVGMGCCLVAREVYERVPKPWFRWQTVDGKPDEYDHRALGEDMYFCAAAQSHGYRVMLVTGCVCQHIGEYFYDETLFENYQIHYFRKPPEGRMSIAFVVAPSPKEWDGRSLYDSPLGGSEASVAYLARSLARLHHVVYVICNTRGGEVIDVDGVCYRPYSALGGTIKQSWDALVVVRWPDAMTMSLDPSIKTLLFWAHDLYGSAQWPELKKAWGLVAPNQTLVGDPIDAFVALTPWHASLCGYPGASAPILVIPNGLDLDLFKGEEERVPGRLVWTSNPNRGLMSAVRVFRELRKRWPHFEFHIYGRSSVYGWNTASDPMHEGPYLPRVEEEEGVFLHDPLPKPALARELMKAWAMFYSSTWYETFAISVTEAEAAGVPVVAPPLGALVHTVQGGILTYDFPAAFEALMEPNEWELQSLRGKAFARTLSWDAIAVLWQDWIANHIKEREEKH